MAAAANDNDNAARLHDDNTRVWDVLTANNPDMVSPHPCTMNKEQLAVNVDGVLETADCLYLTRGYVLAVAFTIQQPLPHYPNLLGSYYQYGGSKVAVAVQEVLVSVATTYAGAA